MIYIVSMISVFGAGAGIYSLVKKDKFKAIAALTPALLCPAITIKFFSLQYVHCFGGTKWEYFFYSATVDGDPWPWILLILLIAELIFIVRTIVCLLSDIHNQS